MIPSSERKRDISSEQVAHELSARFGSTMVRLESETSVVLTPDARRAIILPDNLSQLGEALAFASERRWRVVPMGAGTWLEMGNPPTEAHLFVSTSRMNRILEYEPADLTATVEAGCTLAAFNAGSRQHRQFIPLDPFGDEAQTLGAIVATASYGTLRCGFGTPRDWVIGMRVAHADGRITKAGGKVVKNVAGYDLCKLYTGSFGTLGVIGEISFKLRALPSSDCTVIIEGDDITELCRLAARVTGSDLQPSAIEIFSPAAVGVDDMIRKSYAMAVRFVDETETIDSETQHLAELSGKLISKTLTETDASALWNAYRASETDSRWVWSLRVSVLPTDLAEMIKDIRALMPSSSCSVHAANGIIRVFDETESLDGLKSAQRPRKVAELRQAAQQRGGHLVIMRAPDPILEKLDVWGEVGETERLMRELKVKFDPQSLLNSGRFVAGI